MILTEAEARNKECREAVAHVKCRNDCYGFPFYAMGNCIGSQCMAWRWWGKLRTWIPPFRTQGIPPMPETDPETGKSTEGWTDEDIRAWAEKHKPEDGEGWVWDPEDFCWFIPGTPKPRRGYCGKAGKPDHE